MTRTELLDHIRAGRNTIDQIAEYKGFALRGRTMIRRALQALTGQQLNQVNGVYSFKNKQPAKPRSRPTTTTTTTSLADFNMEDFLMKHRHLNHATSWKAGYTAPKPATTRKTKNPAKQKFRRPW